jgi:hypothetical protein
VGDLLGWEADLDDVQEGGQGADMPWGPSPTEGFLREIETDDMSDLPELNGDDLDELESLEDDPIPVHLGEGGEVINEVDDLDRPNEENCDFVPIVRGRVGPNTPENVDYGEFSDEMWVSAQKLAKALTKYARESGADEPPLSPMKVTRSKYGDVRRELNILVSEGASTSASSTAWVDRPNESERAPEEAQDRVPRAVERNRRQMPLVVHNEPEEGLYRVRMEGENLANPRDCHCDICVALRVRRRRASMNLNEVIVIDSPSSPDAETDREWELSSSSDEAGNDPYQPIVSPITSEVTSPVSTSDGRRMGASAAQRCWSEGYGPMRGRLNVPARRVALIQPQPGRTGRPVTAHRPAGVFRVTTQAPVIQTRSVISRILMRDGSLMEESLHDRFVMARTVSTQTVLRGGSYAEATMSVEVISDAETDHGESRMEAENSSEGTPLLDE